MKNLVILVLISIATVSSVFGQDKTSCTIELEKFNEIQAFDQINVTLIKSDKNQAVITGNDVQEASVVNDDGRLKVRMEIDNILDGNETNVTPYHIDDFSLLDANEDTKITSEDELNSKYLTPRPQEGGIINVKIQNINNNNGVIACAIFESEEGFPRKFLKFASKIMLTQIGGKDASIVFSGIKPGKYAVAVIHDENRNGELDTNLFGIPTEGYGFSSGAEVTMSAPSFSDAEFYYDGGHLEMSISLNY